MDVSEHEGVPEIHASSPQGSPFLLSGKPLLLCLLLLFLVTPILIYLPSFDSVVLPKTVWVALLTCLLAGLLVLQPQWTPRSVDDLRTPLDLPVLGVLVTASLSIWLQGGSLTGSVAFRLLAMGMLLVYLLVYLFRRYPEWVALCRGALLFAAVLVAGYVILQDRGIDPLPWTLGQALPDWRFRLPGTMGNPNAVAGFLAVVLPALVVDFYLAGSSWRRVLTGLGLLVVLSALVVTFSVGAWLGIAFGGLLVSWVLRKKDYAPMSWPAWTGIVVVLTGLFLFAESSEHRSFMMAPLRVLKAPAVTGLFLVGLLALAALGCSLLSKRLQVRRGVVSIPFLLLLVVALFYFTPNPWNGRPGSILDQARASKRWKTGGGARRFIWQTTALMVKEHPVRGIGFGRYYKVHALYQGQLYQQRSTPHDRPTVGKVPQVHNEYYQQVAETGLLGSAPFFWLVLGIVALWEKAYKRATPRERAWVLASVVGLAILMVHALTSFPLRRPSTWLAGAFLLAYVLAKADPAKPGRTRERAAQPLSPAIRVVILGALAFQVIWIIRPLVSNVYLQRAYDSLLSPTERWQNLSQSRQWEPEAFEPHYTAAVWLYRAGRYEQAIEEGRLALLAHEDLEARRLISDAYLAQGRLPEAARAWEDVLRLNPCFPPFLREGASLYSRAGDSQQAALYGQRALELDPEALSAAPKC